MDTESMRKCVVASQALTEALARASVANMACGWFESLTAGMKESGALQKRLETMLKTATDIRKCDVCTDEVDGDGLYDGEQLLCEFCDEKKHGPERLQEQADRHRELERDSAVERGGEK